MSPVHAPQSTWKLAYGRASFKSRLDINGALVRIGLAVMRLRLACHGAHACPRSASAQSKSTKAAEAKRRSSTSEVVKKRSAAAHLCYDSRSGAAAP